MTREEEALVCPYCTDVIIGFGRDIDDEASLLDYLEQLEFTAALQRMRKRSVLVERGMAVMRELLRTCLLDNDMVRLK